MSTHTDGSNIEGCRRTELHTVGQCSSEPDDGPTYSDGSEVQALVDAALSAGDKFRIAMFAPGSGAWMWEVDATTADAIHGFLGKPAATDGIGQRTQPRHGESGP
jgi:hypothetical protein